VPRRRSKKTKKLNKKEISFQEKIKKIKELCEAEARKVAVVHKSKFKFDHFDAEVKMVFVKEEYDSTELLEHEMLDDLRMQVKEIDKRWVIGMIYQGKKND